MAEAGFHEALNGFRVIGLHDHVRSHADLLKKTVDNQAHIAAPRIEQKGSAVQVGGAQRADMSAADFVRRRADDEQLLFKQWNHIEIVLGHRKGNESQIEAAVEQAGNHFLGNADGHADFRVGIAFAKLAQWAAQLVDQSGDPGGEMEGTHVFGEVVLKFLLNVAHHFNDLFRVFGQTQSRGRRNQALATAHKEFRAELIGQIMELKTDGTGGEVNFFRRSGHAGRVHNSKEQFELVDVHLPSLNTHRRSGAQTHGGNSTKK